MSLVTEFSRAGGSLTLPAAFRVQDNGQKELSSKEDSFSYSCHEADYVVFLEGKMGSRYWTPLLEPFMTGKIDMISSLSLYDGELHVTKSMSRQDGIFATRPVRPTAV